VAFAAASAAAAESSDVLVTSVPSVAMAVDEYCVRGTAGVVTFVTHMLPVSVASLAHVRVGVPVPLCAAAKVLDAPIMHCEPPRTPVAHE
jgi:hypothetical protein